MTQYMKLIMFLIKTSNNIKQKQWLQKSINNNNNNNSKTCIQRKERRVVNGKCT